MRPGTEVQQCTLSEVDAFQKPAPPALPPDITIFVLLYEMPLKEPATEVLPEKLLTYLLAPTAVPNSEGRPKTCGLKIIKAGAEGRPWGTSKKALFVPSAKYLRMLMPQSLLAAIVTG